MKRWIALICVLCLLFSLCLLGCSKQKQEEEPSEVTISELPQIIEQAEVVENEEKSDETLTVALSLEPAHLINKMGAGMDAAYIRTLLGDTLTRVDYSTMELKPGLLTEWEFVDDLHIRAKVREGVIAADGTEFKADDIIFSLEKGAEMAPVYMAKYFNVPNCVAEDDYTVLLELASDNPYVMYELTSTVCTLYDASSYEASGGDDGATVNPQWGTGRYKFVEWKPGQYILLERNEDYWDEAYIGYYKYIKFTFVPDSATRIMAVQSGDADIAVSTPLAQSAEMEGQANCQVISIINNQVYGIELNCSEQSILGSDLRLRQAIRYALDKDVLNQILTLGYGQREDFWLMSESQYAFDPTGGAGSEYNPDKARALLKEAGYEDGLEITILGITQYEELLTAIQHMLGEVGIALTIDMSDQTVLVEKAYAGNFDMTVGAHPALCWYRGLTNFEKLSPRQVEAGSVNGGARIMDAALQEAIDLAVSSKDDEEGKKAIAEIEQILWDNAGFIGISSYIYTAVASPSLGGFVMETAGGALDLGYVTPVK